MNEIQEVLKEKGISKTWFAKLWDKDYKRVNGYARNMRESNIEEFY